MAQLLDPITQRDFSAGRIAKSAVATALMPNYSSHSLTSAINSVANSINVDFSEVIGSGIVRKGKKQFVQIAANTVIAVGYQPATTNFVPIYGTNQIAQIFSLSSAFTLTSFWLKLSRVGVPVGFATLKIQGVSGGVPNGVDLLPPITFDVAQLSAAPTFNVVPFYTEGNSYIFASQVALVLSYPLGDVVNNYILVTFDNTTTVAGTSVQESTNSGSTWSGAAGTLYFTMNAINNSSPYSSKPLGNFSFLGANVGRNVVAFAQPNINVGVIYWWQYTTGWAGSWQVSTLNNLSNNAFVRFAYVNGSVFEANGAQVMHDSSDYGNTWGVLNSITANSVIPSLLLFSQGRLLASGYSVYPNRIYFSSLVDPTAPGGVFITWNTDPTAGDFLDIDSSSGPITGWANSSTLTLVFTTNGMYRLNSISKTVDAENVYNVGAVGQETITSCQGLVYFYSGKGIYSTDSTFPQQISRIGVQDFVDAIQVPTEVYAWADEFNVYFSIGSVTLKYGPEDKRTYNNVVLKFSPRDQNWQVFTYNQQLAQTSIFGPEPNFGNTINNEILPGLLTIQYNGYLAWVNNETISDDSGAIPYNLETQEQEFGNRAHTKDISDEIVVFAKNGTDGMFSVKENDGDFNSSNMTLNNRVNVGTDIDFEAEFFTFRWQGEALNSRPILEGYHLPKVTDLGIINKNQ